MRLELSEVEFTINGKEYKLRIVHNMPKTKGLSLSDAIPNWAIRTTKHTAQSLCNYIMEKDQSVTAMTEKTYKRISQYGS